MQQLASLALLEVRFFPRCENGRLEFVHTSFNLDWMSCLWTAQAAAAVCEVLLRPLRRKGDSFWGRETARGEIRGIRGTASVAQ
jgi:hypothetical protein